MKPVDIIVSAIARSTMNRQDILANNTEMLRVFGASILGAYSIASEVNPEFFASAVSVNYVAPGWARPADAEAVFRIELASGAEVAVVPYDDQLAEPLVPSVYSLGQIFRPTGNTNGPTIADSLRFFYSRVPTIPATVDTDFEAAWPSQFNPLLIEDIAAYLALKDGRMDEARSLADERNRWLVLYVKYLEHETLNLRRRFGQRKQYNTRSIAAAFAPYLVSGGVSDNG